MTEIELAQGTVNEALSIASLLKRISWVILMATIVVTAVFAFSPSKLDRLNDAVLSPPLRTTLGLFLALLGGTLVLILRAVSIGLRLLSRLVESLERLREVLEAGLGEISSGRAPTQNFSSDRLTLDRKLAECREAIRGGAWDDALSLIQKSSQTHPDHPEISKLAEEFWEARRAASREWLAKIQAARDVNDPERVIELHAELKALIDANELQIYDRDLARWFLSLIHRRLRVGTVSRDLVALAVKVAGTLDGTLEGSSLRASLPTLRRAAGLCAHCGQSYNGVADTCPLCLAASKRE